MARNKRLMIKVTAEEHEETFEGARTDHFVSVSEWIRGLIWHRRDKQLKNAANGRSTKDTPNERKSSVLPRVRKADESNQ